ncbi:MAG: helix-turn-helix domain-containing protein [Sphingobacteriales bacterium]|uniref:helix-turn-helix domain-containing protein n=1 Tax=Hydrotalea flava TaxID=714549 RepID=UPI000836AD44|nr:helix-turn-helix transcriptional regulator [Hydrotalea flava]RTL49079.1 MAG: helix-turn-helix domain-containing protein [Sphingobacteriales bacterium]
MAHTAPYRIQSISEFHRLSHLPQPEHPLVSVVDYAQVAANKREHEHPSITFDYYSISIKRGLNGRMRYGQQEYDFDEGVMYFLAPGQVLQIPPYTSTETAPSGWILLIHPDFLWNTPLAKTIAQYEFFDYSVHEALFLSEKEEAIINGIIQNIQQEYHGNIDKFSQSIIIAQIETLLNYSQRFYQRQFITRQKTNHQMLERLEKLLADYFNNDDLALKGLPTVQYIANRLNVSPNYLSGLLKALTGQNTQQLIHEKLIEKAKEKLSTTHLSVSEIAYELGFEHPQSFSKLFKTKTNLSPLEFRQSFN